MRADQAEATSVGTGEALWSVGVLARIRARGEETGGMFALVEELCPPGYATPLHTHHREDEGWYVLEGRVTLFRGDERIEAGPGSHAFGPRGVPHGFRVEGAEPARVLVWTSPAGFERFIAEMGSPASSAMFAENPALDLERLSAAAERYGIELLGPLPD